MVTVKVIWAEDHTAEQSQALVDFCARAQNQGKLRKMEFEEDGSPVYTFNDAAGADEYVALISPWNPTEIIRS